MAIEKLSKHQSTGVDQIPTELMKTGAKNRSEKYNLINSILNKEVLFEVLKDSIILCIYKKILVGKTEGKRPLEEPGLEGRIILRWIFRT